MIKSKSHDKIDKIRFDWNIILSIKRCFKCLKKDKSGRESFEELNFEAESKR